jgi:hypothetical protein
MSAIYGAAIGLSLLYRLYVSFAARGARPASASLRSLAHSLLCLALPSLALAGWLIATTGRVLLSTGQPLSLWMFWRLLPDMLQMLFYIPWYGAALTLAVLGFCAWRGLRSPRLPIERRLVFTGWMGMSIVALLIYTATPGVSNSPRVVLPILPALALLAAEGWGRLPRRWGMRVAFYLIALFCVVNLCITYYAFETARYNRSFAGVHAILRTLPRGFVMTSDYWSTVWETRQPVTWFESDPQFQQNILGDRANFEQYVSHNPIRYVVVPRAGTEATNPVPLLGIDLSQLYSDGALDYLRTHARRIPVPPDYDLYVLPNR